ncbi:MAG: tetratricopeptide repeat protein [Treponema sp.]|nr:tetratricopeptide repeat protein [Treponema sp.]
MRITVALLGVLLFVTPDGALFAQAGVGANAHYQAGRSFMMAENWYSAVESFLEALRLNQSHAGAAAALAECYYELGEFDQALIWVRRARVLSRANLSLANLEASTLIALGRLNEAQSIISDILRVEPHNREAVFVAAELDIARGRAGDAVSRYREAARRFPDDRRVLVSLALVLGSLGDTDNARAYIDRALERHPGDFRVYYYAAYLASRAGRIPAGIVYAENALHFRPGFNPARSLLASLRFRAGQYEEAARLADELIAARRTDSLAWYLKGMAYIRMERFAEAQILLSTAADIDPDNEFIRAALEELLITRTRLEDPVRARWAAWHFNRAREFRSRHLIDQALFQFRRGLRLNPYAPERREYADLLRLQGFPARHLEELRFMQDLGMGDTALNDAVEAFNALLVSALFRRWGVDPIMVSQPLWNVAVFSLASQSTFYHVDAGAGAASFVQDILVHERNIRPMSLELRQPSFASAFAAARAVGADYFLVVSVSENERDISLTGELFVTRTGARAAAFNTFRTGPDRLRDASRGIANQLSAALPFRAELIGRQHNQGLINKGRADGVRVGDEFDIVQRGRAELLNEGIGLVYSPQDVVGRLIIETADEEVASGRLVRNGFFDRITTGDEVFLSPVNAAAGTGAGTAAPAVDPELRALLRTLR